ncbi:MAG TPA: tetratricopeptide repeat protein [Ktedonobacterales bacterium]|nr:tetratricopeptide repeat protein [Ktedonobacterales bacterium]
MPLGTACIGREALLHALKHQLLSGAPASAVALSGLPGVGKTTVALELASDAALRASFGDGILWATLGPAAQPMTVLRQWGRLLGFSAPDLAELSSLPALCQALHGMIGDRRLLLVLDDAWRLDDALACQVGGPNCASVLTTRFPSVARDFAPQRALHLPELSEAEGLLLLKAYDADLVACHYDQALALVRAVGGLPLGLQLMGKYLRQQAMTGSSRRVQAALTRLDDAAFWAHLSEPLSPLLAPPHLSHPTPRSLQATIAITIQRLSLPARHALRALAVFPPKPQTFPERAALAVTETPPEALDELVDAGVLECLPEERYTVHPAIAEVVRSSEPATGAEQALVRFYAQFLSAQEHDYQALDEEHATIRVTLELANRLEMGDELVQSVVAFMPYLLARGEGETAEQLWARASAVTACEHNKLTRVRLLLRRGQLATYQGQWQVAGEAIKEGIALVRDTRDLLLHCQLLQHLGTVLYKQGKYLETEAVVEAGAALAREGEESELGAFLYLRGIVSDKQGKYPEASRWLRESLQLAQQAQDAARIGQCLIGLGDLAKKRGEWQEERASYQEAVAIYRRLGHRERVCAALIGLGIAHENLGKRAQAETEYQEALGLARQLGHRERLSSALLNYGRLLFQRGEHQQAEDCYREALALAQTLGAGARTCSILSNLASVFGVRGDLAQARDAAQRALEVARQLQHQDHICYALRNLGEIAYLQGALTEAEHYLREGQAIAEQIASPVAQAFCNDGVATVACLRQQYPAAERALAAGLAMAERHHLSEQEAVLTVTQARLSLAQGHPRKAAKTLQKAEAYARTQQLFWLLGETLNVQGEVALTLGYVKAAQGAFTEAQAIGKAIQSCLCLALATYGLARVAAHHGRREEAERHGQESLELFERMGHYQAAAVKRWMHRCSNDSTWCAE